MFTDSAVLHGILKGHCLDSRLHPKPPNESSRKISAQSVEKWLRYRQFRVSVVVVGGWWVGSDALLSSSPSLIWLQLGFGLARAVTI